MYGNPLALLLGSLHLLEAWPMKAGTTGQGKGTATGGSSLAPGAVCLEHFLCGGGVVVEGELSALVWHLLLIQVPSPLGVPR